ncbi:glycerol-3-phosphate 1-O-acyltransferase PlsY [Spiroplasma sp. BIUS-1]|uniref:glycerol-3-phosphate 1-O-acyltransferase PlsY n=1 Tax=Spiroplasma sp. BIUS-1 TaxID=216964 RepID=UPI001397D65D|nr:glycerol-3-phosphate 1-O-acyltransferase PlsY [Spiroplasma sp. BIUS-1]QHX36667.1 glycerol-3-phosphate acyltransferase PlsY [Spiroplasma sp. BIUS-1]
MSWEIVAGTAIASVVAYLIGSFSFSITIVKLKTNKDVRDQGSKNAGATNASRIIGKKWGVAIMLFDAFKIFIALFIALGLSKINTPIFRDTILIIPAFFALVGHCWPVYYKFKGGKAVSCFMGLMFVINWMMGIVMFGVWLTLVLTTRKVSIASIFASVITAILMWIPQISGLHNFDIDGTFFKQLYESNAFSAVWYNKLHTNDVYDSFLVINLVTTASMIILLARHWQNIQRLIKGTEPAFLGERKSKKDKPKKEKVKKQKPKKEKAKKDNKKKSATK